MATVSSAGLPKASHTSQRSRKKSSDSLLREPFGLPLGLPDWPGFHGINPRCLCFRTVESLSAASAFDIGPIKPQTQTDVVGSCVCQSEHQILKPSLKDIEGSFCYPRSRA